MNEENKVVSFTVEEINQILAVLGDIPAKYSFDLVNFIRAKAQEQLKEEQSDLPQEKVEE